MAANASQKSSWLIKVPFLLFMLILIPMYLYYYGWQNFLWLSDVGLFLTFFALWVSSPLLMSMTLIALPLEIAWNIDFFVQLLSGRNILGIANYMFDDRLSLFLRGLSLFHVVLPLLWIWYLLHWGYNKRAFIYTLFLFWLVTIVTYVSSKPEDNINWVFMPVVHQWQGISPVIWVLLLMIGFPLFIFLPMHILLSKITRINPFGFK